MSETAFTKTTDCNPPSDLQPLRNSPYVATAAEAVENYRENPAGVWYTDRADPEDAAGKCAFQRLRHTWFTPEVVPKFKLSRDDKFYAIGSCFARGIESSLTRQKITVESAALEFARRQPVSPVPLMNTFSTMDIVVANTWAKSLLRAVAQEWASAHQNVDYFPSYEIVHNSDRAAVWEDDLRHVKGAGAQHIVELFLRNYLD